MTASGLLNTIYPFPFAGYISQAVKLGAQVLPTYRVFSLEELREATRNFERASYIGEGLIGKVWI